MILARDLAVDKQRLCKTRGVANAYPGQGAPFLFGNVLVGLKLGEARTASPPAFSIRVFNSAIVN